MKHSARTLADLEERPPFKAPHRFPVEELQKHLAALFARPEIEVKVEGRGWVAAESLEEGMPPRKMGLELLCPPLKHPFYFAVGQEDLKFLMADLLGGEKVGAPFFEEAEVKGFYHFLALEVLSLLDQFHFCEDLSFSLGDEAPSLPSVECFLFDVLCTTSKGTFRGRLFLPKPFREEWNAHFASFPPPPLTQEEREKIPVDVAVVLGTGQLSYEEWKGVKEGDYILLDHAFYDVTSGKGRVILSLNGEPLFRGKLQSEGIKLLEYPMYQEVVETMDEEFEEREEESEELSTSEGQGDHTPTVTPEKIPLQITVEAARIRMSVEELMQLTPGQIIDLKVHPERGVDLVVGGKRIGKGELIKVGDVLGLRILSL